jgi:hypothetical protein
VSALSRSRRGGFFLYGTSGHLVPERVRMNVAAANKDASGLLKCGDVLDCYVVE